LHSSRSGHWGWSTFWIDFGIAGWGIAAAVGVGFVGPELGRIDRAAATYGPDSPEVARRFKRLFTVFRFDTALLILIVADMAAKPSFSVRHSSAGSLAAPAVSWLLASTGVSRCSW